MSFSRNHLYAFHKKTKEMELRALRNQGLIGFIKYVIKFFKD